MKKSAFYSDLIFTFFITALFTLCLFRYLGISLWLSFLLATVCGVLAAMGVGALLQSKRNRLFLKKSDETQKQKLLTHLALSSDEEKTSFFQTALSKSERVKRFGKLRLHAESGFYFLKFRFSPVTSDEIASLSRLKTGKEKILLCNEIEAEAAQLCQQLKIRLKTGDEVYAMLKTADALPEQYLGETTPQNKRQRRLRACFAKSNSKRFLIGGALVLSTSLLTPFPYYYLLLGSLLLLTAVFIRIFGYSQ